MPLDQSPGGMAPGIRPVIRWYRKRSRRLAAGAGAILSLSGIVVAIYSDLVRKFIDTNLLPLGWAASTLVLMTASAYIGMLGGGRRLKDRLVVIEDKAHIISPDVAIEIVGPDAVVGRLIRYLECVNESPELLVFFHGLGLDANDFRGFMAETRYHTIAVTMFGFDERDRDDRHYGPISIDSHLTVLESFLAWLRQQYPGKTLHLAGFSFGADLLMFLAERQATRGGRLAESVILLDPNVNRSTMFISTAICNLDTSHPLGGLKNVLESAGSLIEFQNLCSYLHKVSSKNLGQVQRLACDVRAKWEESGYTQFLNRLRVVDQESSRTSVAFSFHYEEHFNELQRAARQMNFGVTSMHCTEFDHFQLIGPRALHRQVDTLIARRDH